MLYKTNSKLEKVRKEFGLQDKTTSNDKSKSTSNSTKSKASSTSKSSQQTKEKSRANISSAPTPAQSKLETVRQQFGLSDTSTSVNKPSNNTSKKYIDVDTTNKPTNYASAVKYLQDKGVQGAAGIMTENEWRRRNKNGGTYQDYLDNQIYLSQSVSLDVNDNGKTRRMGNLSLGAYKAIEENTLDRYVPKTAEEEKTIAEYIKFAEEYAKKQREPENFGQGLLHGIGYTLEKIGSGAVGGVADAGNFINAGALKLLSIPTWGSWEDKLNETAESVLSSATLGDVWDNSIESRYRVPDWYRETMGTTASNFGALLPAMTAEIYSGGTSPLLESQIASQTANAGIKGALSTTAKNLTTIIGKPKPSDVVFGLSAAGGAAKSGYAQSGDVGKSLNYGVLNGLGEVATEKLFGGLAGTGIGADDLIDLGKVKGVSKIANNKYGSKVLGLGLEGVEEIIMAEADPVFQMITVNPKAEFADFKDLGESGFQGVLLSAFSNVATFPVRKYSKTKTIQILNRTSDSINALLVNDADKLKLLRNNASYEEIEERQNQIKVFKEAYAETLENEVIASNPELFAERHTPTQAPIEQASRDVVSGRNNQSGTPLSQRLEAQSRNNEQIAVEDVKKVTGFGEEGSKLVAELANKDGVTFRQAENQVKTAYMAGMSNADGKKVSFVSDVQIDAFTAGKKDRANQELLMKAKAKNATVYNGAFHENEYTKNYTDAEKTMISTFSKVLRMDVDTVDKIIASVVNGREYEANAEHQDGRLQISNNRDASAVVYKMVMHESGHRMRQLAPTEFGALMDALYARSMRENAKVGRSQNAGFENVKAEHDNAGITMNTSGYMEEFAVRELETLFNSPEAFNAWYAEISNNQQAKTGLQKFMNFISELIEDIKRAVSELVMPNKANAIKELERIKELYANALKAAEKSATERAKAQAKQRAEAKAEQGKSVETTKTKATDGMRKVLGDGDKFVGVADGQAYVTNGKDILPSPTNRSVFIPVNDVEAAKTEFGATESNKTSANISKILESSSFVPVSDKFVDGTLNNVGEVRVFTDQKGREIALEKNVAEYFEGYNLEATFRGGKPYAIKATDNDGNVTGVALAIWMNTSGQKYDITDAKEVSIKAESGKNFSLRNSESGRANDLLLPYDDELIGFIKHRGDYIVSNFEDLKNIVNLAFENGQKKATAYFGIIPSEIMSKIEKNIPNLPRALNGVLFKTGKDYSIATTLDSIRHLVDEKSLSKDEIIDYLDRMADTIVEYDTVAFDYYYENGNRMNGLLFKKAFEDGVLTSFEIVSSKKRSLNLQTFYMQKGDYKKKKSASSTLLEKKPTADVQDEERSNFNDRIPQNPEFVKGEFSATTNEGLDGGAKYSLKDSEGTIADAKGNVVAQINENGTASFSLKTYDDSGRAELKKWLDRNVKSKKITEADAKDISEQLEYFYDICKEYEDKYAPFSAWSKAEIVKGLDGKPLMSVVKSNGDYSMNLDFSLVCKKRRPLDALYRAMIDDGFMDNIGQLSEVDVAKINEIIRKNGFETACTLCFVDSKRYRQYAVADSFVSKYNELVKMLAPEGAKIDRFDFSGKRQASADGLHTMSNAELKAGINKLNKVIKENGEATVVGKIANHLKAFPQDRKLVMVSDFMDSEGFVRVKKANPNVFKLYNSSKGSGGPKATLPDVQYLGEILKRSNFTPKKAYAVGGVRVQSFSDYIPRLVFDYLQMTADLSAKKLPAHAYSKEDIFVMQFGKTGIKINMSLVPAVAKDGIAAGLDKDGNYVWVDGHTFASDFHDKGSGQRGFELAVKIQNTEGYSQNCGTIAVGVSDEHIIKMLKDNDIRMVIPYHKSSLNHFVAKMGNIDQYKDYTNVQNTRDKATGKKIEGKDFNFNEAFHRLGDAKAATNEYLAWCEENNYIPKFDTFAFHQDAEVRENYYKVLIDFAAYDSEGNATPQGAVTMNFPTESDAFGSMKELIAKGLEADAILEGRKTENIPKILEEVKSALGTANEGKNDTQYSLKDSDGKTLTEAQAEFFKDSKVVTSDGRLKIVYHGTSNGGFTWFDTYAYYSKFGLFGNGAYFTENRDIAESYTTKGRGNKPQVYSVYLNITNPIDMDAKADVDAWNKALQKTGEDFSLLEGELTNEQAFRSMVEDLEYCEVYDYDAAEIVRNVFEDMGYNGITHIGGGRVNKDGIRHRVWIAFEQDQIKSTTNTNPTNNPDINFSLKGGLSDSEIRNAIADKKLSKYVDNGTISTERYNELVKIYGAIPTGERPHRDVQVPQRTGKNKKVSQTVRTILEAKATPDEAVPTIEKMVEDGVFSYDAYTDKQAINDAESYIKEYGWDESLDDWFDAVEKGEVSKELTTMGWALYNNAANTAATTTSETERTSAIKTSLKILDAMVRHQRSAAQALQATRILKKLSPETQLYGVQKSVSAFQKELVDKYGDKAPDLKIDEELAEQFINAKTPEERAEIEAEIYKDIGRQIPSRFIDKWNAWRYLAMLGNVRTHGRNIVGNAGFAPIVIAKNLTATGIESAVRMVSGKKTVRGKALVWGSKADKALLKAAWADYSNVADMISNGGKYNDSALSNQMIEDGRQIFKFKPLEWARKGNSWLLDKEDMWFAKPHYAYALAQYCKANNITADQIARGKAIAPARNYAIKEAQKATYRDTNAFSQMVSDLGRSNKNEKNVVKKFVNTVIEGILPFRKTPANILVRGVEYSPLGLIKGLSYDLVQVGKGKISASEAIDNVSAGLTGTGLLALGVYLAAQGIIRGHGEDDEEKEFKELMGHQSYALELPNGQSVTLDWLAPEALPFFVGVNIWETSKGTDEEMNLSTVLQAVSGISEPMLEMSCLQSLNDVFESVGYASSNDTSGLVSVLSSATTSYLTQGIPTLLGQAERTGEENRMTTYTEKDAFLTGDMQYTLGKVSAKIPFWDYNQIPYIDAWGRKEASGTALKRGLNNFLNPAYTSTIETSKMEEELLRLYEATGEGGVFPTRADKYFTVDGVRKDLTAEEYVRYATLKGGKSYKLISDLIKSEAYKKLSDEEKVKTIKETYDYANQKSKEAISNYKPDKWVARADEFSPNVGNYIAYKSEVSSTREENGGKISKQEIVDIIIDMAQNDSEAWNMFLSEYESEEALKAQKYGIDAELYIKADTAMYDMKADYIYNGKRVDGKDLTAEQKKKAKQVKNSRKNKIVKYLNSVCTNEKEYMFLLGTEYDSVLDDSAYVKYFGKE